MGQAIASLDHEIPLGDVTNGGAMRFLTDLLDGVKPEDPRTLAAVSAALILAACAGALFPARRAIRVDPMIALRGE